MKEKNYLYKVVTLNVILAILCLIVFSTYSAFGATKGTWENPYTTSYNSYDHAYYAYDRNSIKVNSKTTSIWIKLKSVDSRYYGFAFTENKKTKCVSSVALFDKNKQKLKNFYYDSDNNSDSSVEDYYYRIDKYPMESGKIYYVKAVVNGGTAKAKFDFFGYLKEPVIDLEEITYGFENFSKRVPLSICKYMYGNNTMAKKVYDIQLGVGGNCFGMATTSSILYKSKDVTVKSFNPSKQKVFQLTRATTDKNTNLNLTAEDFIQAMHVTQLSSYIKEVTVKNLDNFINQVKYEVEKDRPVLICIYGSGGHAITAYGVEETSSTKTRILVYDNNWPFQKRYIEISKNQLGAFSSWKYELWPGEVWGTGHKGAGIGFITYDEVVKAWNMHGKLANVTKNLLSVNSDDISIYDSEDKLLAKVDDGVLTTDDEDIYDITPLDITKGDDSNTERCILSLPVAHYIVENNEKEIDDFEVSIVNKELGATVTTESDRVEVYADDYADAAGATIETDADDKYFVTLESSKLGQPSSVEYEGIGKGIDVSVDINEGETHAKNADDAKIQEGNINKLNISSKELSIKLSNSAYTYNGKNKEPKVTLKEYEDPLKLGKHYTVSYSGNKNVGNAKVILKGIENCYGSITKTFKINPKGTSVKKLYKAKKAFTVKWSKQSAKMSTSRITGYQIQYSTSSKFASGNKAIKVKGYAKTSKKISKLKAKKKYYVRVRTYKTINGNTFYSTWSPSKSVLTK